jgi:hypothetical protein
MLNFVFSLIGNFLARKVNAQRMAFLEATKRPRETQHEFLQELIGTHAQSDFGRDHHFSEMRTAADFRQRMKIAEYEDFAPYIERVKNGDTNAMFCNEQIIMFNLTSGTSNARKFIPVTNRYLSDYRRGWSMWGLTTFEKYPELFLQPKISFGSASREFSTPAGIPCGSLSGLTVKMNPGVIRSTYCLPADTADHADAFARCYLNWRVGLLRNIGMGVAPNPGLLLQFARYGNEHADQLIREVHDGTHSCQAVLPKHLQSWLKRQTRPNRKRAAELEQIRSRTGRLYPVDVWPQLKLISCWLGGPTRAYIPQIPEYFGNVALRDIGLISSESRISLPKEDNTPGGILDVTSAYFEFIPVNEIDSPNPTVLEAADLETDGEYFLLMTTSSGLYRYNIHDVVRVIDWHERTPIIEFLHKGSRIANLFGEKLTESQIVRAVGEAAASSQLSMGDYSVVLPTATEPVAYRAMVELREPVSPEDLRNFGQRLDEAIGRQNYLYERKRKEGLLEALQLIVVERGSWRAWDLRQLARNRGTMDQYKHPFLITDRTLLADFNGDVSNDELKPTPMAQEVV